MLKLLQKRKSKLIENITNIEDIAEAKKMNNIFEIDLIMKEYNKMIKIQNNNNIDYKEKEKIRENINIKNIKKRN